LRGTAAASFSGWAASGPASLEQFVPGRDYFLSYDYINWPG